MLFSIELHHFIRISAQQPYTTTLCSKSFATSQIASGLTFPWQLAFSHRIRSLAHCNLSPDSLGHADMFGVSSLPRTEPSTVASKTYRDKACCSLGQVVGSQQCSWRTCTAEDSFEWAPSTSESTASSRARPKRCGHWAS